MHESGHVLPCAGHGVCGCDGQCTCEDGYSGTNCECTSDTGSCVAPKDRGTVSEIMINLTLYLFYYAFIKDPKYSML